MLSGFPDRFMLDLNRGLVCIGECYIPNTQMNTQDEQPHTMGARAHAHTQVQV